MNGMNLHPGIPRTRAADFKAAALTHLPGAGETTLNLRPSRPAAALRRPRTSFNCSRTAASARWTLGYKPELAKRHGQKSFRHQGGRHQRGPVMKCPFGWKQHGQCALVSDVFRTGPVMDDLAFLMAMASETNVHDRQLYAEHGVPRTRLSVSGGWGRMAWAHHDNLPRFCFAGPARVAL